MQAPARRRKTSDRVPIYCSWGAFVLWLDALGRLDGLPAGLDALLSQAPKSARWQLRASGMDNGLFNPDGSASPLLRRLVNPKRRTEAVGQLLEQQYGHFVALYEGGVPREELLAEFARLLPGSADRALSFFLQAYKAYKEPWQSAREDEDANKKQPRRTPRRAGDSGSAKEQGERLLKAATDAAVASLETGDPDYELVDRVARWTGLEYWR